MQCRIYRVAIHVWSTSSAPSVSAILVSDESEGRPAGTSQDLQDPSLPPSPKITPKKTQIPSLLMRVRGPIFSHEDHIIHLYTFLKIEV